MDEHINDTRQSKKHKATEQKHSKAPAKKDKTKSNRSWICGGLETPGNTSTPLSLEKKTLHTCAVVSSSEWEIVDVLWWYLCNRWFVRTYVWDATTTVIVSRSLYFLCLFVSTRLDLEISQEFSRFQFFFEENRIVILFTPKSPNVPLKECLKTEGLYVSMIFECMKRDLLRGLFP